MQPVKQSFCQTILQVRYNSIVLFTDLDGDKNVLTADVVKKLFALRKKLGEINTDKTGHTSTWDKICSRQRVSRGGGGGGGRKMNVNMFMCL